MANYGVEQGLRKGTRLFNRGQRGVDFFLVLEGSIEIFDVDTEGEPHVLTVHGERQFSGELDPFNDQQIILVCSRTGMNSRVVRVKRADFRKMLSAEPDIGEIAPVYRDHCARGRYDLGEATWTHRKTGAHQTRRISAVFVMIGAEPNTEWLDGCLALDARGFIITGRDEEGRP